MKRRLVTAALPYVNNEPHLGNLIQVLSADAFVRFCRLAGYETLYMCGTDEYGTATENRAAEEGISPRELCDRYHTVHTAIYQWFNIMFDKFGRTSTEIQTEVVQSLFKKLDDHGYIVERTTQQLRCGTCQRFLADRYVYGICPHCGYGEARGDQCEACGTLLDPTDLKEPQCAVCRSTPTLESTNHLYIDLPKLKDRVEAWITEASTKGSWAFNALQITKSWIRDGLHERAITRDLQWGIPVPKPGYEKKVFYVWFDAPIGYISITGNYAVEHNLDWRAFVEYWWKSPEDVELFQFIGKDNIPFHTVIFPSTLLGSGEKWTMLHSMSSTEYLNYESGKFSKSKGIGVFGTDAQESGIPPDVWRFYLFYNRPEKADSLFTWKDFQEQVNGQLIGNLGNLINRTLLFVSRYYGGIIPQGEPSRPLWDMVETLEKALTAKLEKAELREAFRLIFDLSSYANKTFQDGEPWKYRTEEPQKAKNLIWNLCYVVRDLVLLMEPFLPETAAKVASFLGFSVGNVGNKGVLWNNLRTFEGLSHVIHSEILFSKLENETVESLREKYAGTQKERLNTAKPSQHFAHTLDLRVAQIINVERHPKADKLYIETLEIAGETRIIVSGIVPFYREEELINKKIIVAYNLKPAKLRGIESKGMLLAASDKDSEGHERCEVLDAGDVPTGTKVTLENGLEGTPPQEIDVDTFFTVPLEVKDGIVRCADHALTVNGTVIRTQKILNGEVH
ncbi:Methionine--tRNA ligase [Pillotina sp. SPG140]|jgi:methionyl-tRNA synthetase